MGAFLPDDEDIKLTDLLSVEELKMVEAMASRMGRMATLITDENGIPITEGCNFSRFCTDFCRKSPEGRKRCENCDKMGAISALDQKRPVYYFCHANLVDFAAPIMLNGRMIGSIIGGQVLAKPPNPEAMRKVAREIGVDEEEFVKAAQETDIIPIQAIERCTEFIYEFAEMLSSLAYKTYVARRESELAMGAVSAKTDFLANMSHEIRTPMNAILGMTQIALREDMSQRAREYLRQVRSSAEMLLTIINDILDYSKLEAGKMSIIPAVYTPVELIKDVTSIISNRVGNKDVEFIVDMDPSIPSELMGDDVRIKQIIVNLANNAVKFTEHGQVLLSVRQKEIDTENMLLCCSVSDTGIGIKKEDLPKLFHSFEQVDSKRNRKVEGTGLGLAIVKELVDAMGGDIRVESEYEKGSRFSIEVPQKIVNPVRSIDFLQDCPIVLGLFENPYIAAQFERDLTVLGAQYGEVTESYLYEVMRKTSVDYVFMEEQLMNEKLEEFLRGHANTTIVLICPNSTRLYKITEHRINMHKPVSIINTSAVLQHKSAGVKEVQIVEEAFSFRAPEAKVLIVDDNEVNLSVAVGLLEPLEMQIDTAESGKEAIEKAGAKIYDIIFMDHMMPEMDGIEATHTIRERYESYRNIPIVALTANALAGDHELYLKEGLNDHVAKPIELANIVSVLKQWLPADKIMEIDKEELLRQAAKKRSTDGGISAITFLDTEYAMNLLKSEKLYWKILEEYYQMIDKKLKKIKECEVKEEIGTYIVEVHALKSSSKQIGALSLSKKAENLESAGNRHDLATIHNHTDEMLEEYRNLETSLAPYFMKDIISTDEPAGSLSVEELKAQFQVLRGALDELDFDKVEEVLKELSSYSWSEEDRNRVEQLREASAYMDLDNCQELLDAWEVII